MKIKKPVIVIGAGRSGSTVFTRMLSWHPQLSWLSGFMHDWPTRTYVNRLVLRAVRSPIVGPRLREKWRPRESWGFWEHYVPGFSEPGRDLSADDLTDADAQRLRAAFEKLNDRRLDRFLIKITGWSRIGFLQKLFPDALFIHVLRDGRGVASSLTLMDWWRGSEGPDKWGWGPLPAEYEREWEESGRSLVVLAGLQWKMMLDSVERASAGLGDDTFMSVRYEDMCSNQAETFQKVLEFCGLDEREAFMSEITDFPLKNTNHKWKENLSPEDQKLLQRALEGHLHKYDYA